MPPFRLRPGTMVARYELVRFLGAGAGGAVYEARDELLSRSVAVKVLHMPGADDLSAAKAEARFLREGRIASRIRHPNVVGVHDVGVDNGAPFLVLELVDGESLAHLLARERSLPVSRALDLLLPVLSAVAELHASGVVHGDLKPANILLPRGGWASPKLADFGVSRFTEDSPPVSGEFVGTVDYMAPELALTYHVAHERSDQYALGVLLYECTTGQKPFRGSTASEWIHAAASAELQLPSTLESSIPRAFDKVVLRAMHWQPEHRFESIDELADALLPLASEATSARWRSEFAAPTLRDGATERGVDRPKVASRSMRELTVRDRPLGERASLLPSSLRPSSAPAVRDSSRPPPSGPREGRPSVLVVDDDELNLSTFRRAFRREFEITCASSGVQALGLLGPALFDVALVDFAMPGMNGVEFLRAARAFGTDVPAVMVTAHADLAEVQAALLSGLVQALIMKPFEREAILRWVLHCDRIGSMRKSVGTMMAKVEEGPHR